MATASLPAQTSAHHLSIPTSECVGRFCNYTPSYARPCLACIFAGRPSATSGARHATMGWRLKCEQVLSRREHISAVLWLQMAFHGCIESGGPPRTSGVLAKLLLRTPSYTQAQATRQHASPNCWICKINSRPFDEYLETPRS